jgi:hypothetical protein
LAKKSSSPDDAILAGLRLAFAASSNGLLMNGPKGKAIFGAKDKELAESAVAQGLLTRKEVEVKKGKKQATEVHGIITEKGLRRVLDADSPRAVLETLLPAVQALANQKQTETPNLAAFRDELAKATATCVNTVKDAFAKLEDQILKTLPASLAKLESEMLKALPAPAGPAVDPKPVFTALQHALEKVQAPVIPTVPAPTETKLPPTVVSTPDLDGEIVAFVNGWAKEKTVGCQFDVLWDHLKQRHPGLTIGAFQDALRKLHEASRIRLGGWARMLDDIPKPQLALFVSSKVMYYAQPSQPNG